MASNAICYVFSTNPSGCWFFLLTTKLTSLSSREKEELKGRKIDLEAKFASITAVLKDKSYTKRPVPTLKQILRFLKKEKGVSDDVLNTITLENVCEKWNTLWKFDNGVKFISNMLI